VGLSLFAACGSSGSKKSPGGSASATASIATSTVSASSASAAPSSSAPSPSGTTKLSYEQLDDAYQQELFDIKKMRDPYEKKVAAVAARLGKPALSDASSATWFGLRAKDESMPESCYELKIEKNGASAIQTVDDARCGK
jgi:hypothetical protein